MIGRLPRSTKPITALLAVALLSNCMGAARLPEASNRVVIIIDASGSYMSRQASAVGRTVSLLEGMSQTKLYRWETGADTITIISLDAMPDVIWQGGIRDLKSVDSASWSARFQSRADYACCTDVAVAFHLATKHLVGDSRYVKKYLVAFTDGVDEPPTTSLCHCKATALPTGPPAEFPWQELKDVSISVFWMPGNQKLAWRRAASANGVGANFAIYTDSESDHVSIAPPPRPQVRINETEREAGRLKFLALAFTILKWVLGIVAAAMALVVCVSLWARRRRGFAQ